jgi:hypothetical protein
MQYEPIVKAPKYTVAEALKARNMPEKKFLLPWSTLKRDDEAREYLKGNKDLPLPPQTGCSDLVTHVSSTSHNIAIPYAYNTAVTRMGFSHLPLPCVSHLQSTTTRVGNRRVLLAMEGNLRGSPKRILGQQRSPRTDQTLLVGQGKQ